MKTIAITIDVETDWGGRLSVGYGNCQGIEEGIPYLLHLLDEQKIKATFFISGEVVAEYVDIIRDIVEHEHEIASHGFKHNVDYSMMSKTEISEQISKSKKILEDEIGVTPIGFRTPQCRTNDDVYAVLHELIFKYDSSMVRGILPTRYNNLSIPSEPFMKSNLLEIPISAMPYLIGSKSKKDFGFVINRWYNFKSNKVKYTLEGLLNYWKEENRKFVLLRDVAKAEQFLKNSGGLDTCPK